MAKGSRKHVIDRQNGVIHEFQREIHLAKTRDWLTISEQAILDGRNRVKPARIAERFSTYNPNWPLNGSSSWSKADWKRFRETGKGPHQK